MIRARWAVASETYVEEDQEAQGPAPSVEGQPRQASQHGPRLILLSSLRLSAPASSWERLGFSLTSTPAGSSFVAGGLRFELEVPADDRSGLAGWQFLSDEVRPDQLIDGIPTSFTSIPSTSSANDSALGVIGVDHVVIMTPSLDRTCGAIAESLELPLKRIREVGGGVRQGFHRAGAVILEVVERPDIDADQPAQLWGLVFDVADLDAVVDRLGPDVVGAPRDAVQKGRRIATVRAEAGLGCALAFMTPASPRGN